MLKLCRWILGLALASTMLFLLVDCGSNNNANNTQPTLTSLYTNVFSQSCVQCHNGTNTAANSSLNFSSITSAYATLLAYANGPYDGACTSVRIVSPGSPSTSYIMAVLVASMAQPNFGVSGCNPYAVHLQNTSLNASEQSALSTWIQNGAQNN